VTAVIPGPPAQFEPDEGAKIACGSNRPAWRVGSPFFPADQRREAAINSARLSCSTGRLADMVIRYGDYSSRAKLDDLEACQSRMLICTAFWPLSRMRG